MRPTPCGAYPTRSALLVSATQGVRAVTTSPHGQGTFPETRLRRSSKRSELVRDDAVVVQRQLHESVRGCWFGEAVSVEAPRFARHS
jgi:hypothetical protein